MQVLAGRFLNRAPCMCRMQLGKHIAHYVAIGAPEILPPRPSFCHASLQVACVPQCPRCTCPRQASHHQVCHTDKHHRPRSTPTPAAPGTPSVRCLRLAASAQTVTRDVVITDHPSNNITDNIFQKIGVNLHQYVTAFEQLWAATHLCAHTQATQSPNLHHKNSHLRLF